MDIELFREDMLKIRLSNELKERIIHAAADNADSNQTLSQVRKTATRAPNILRPAILIPLIIFMAVGSILFFLFPGILDEFTVTGCPPGFTDRYYALIELDNIAYVYQGNGTLYRFTVSEPLQKIKHLAAENILSDGESFFYSKGAHIFQIFLDKTGKKKVFSEGQDITLDYVNAEIMVYHFGNHDRYTVLYRNTGEKERLFDISDEKCYNFHNVSGDYAVFDYSSDGQDALYTVNLRSGQKAKIVNGAIRNRVVIIDGIVFFTQTGMPENKTSDLAKELWSVHLNGTNLHQLDISGMPYEAIQAIAVSGHDLLIATDEQYLSHHGIIYLYQPDTGAFSILQNQVGLIDRLFATDHYFSYYDLGIGDVAGKAYVGWIKH